MREITATEVAERTANRNLCPTESDFAGLPGYQKSRRGNGRWRYQFQPNDGHGRLTRAGSEVQERMAPYQRAEVARQLTASAALERVELRDSNGQTHYVEAALADDTARRDGWSHVGRHCGNPVERGPDGMLWKRLQGVWEPTGRWCTSEPWTQTFRPEHGCRCGAMKCRGVQRDPDGQPWRGLGTEWVRL